MGEKTPEWDITLAALRAELEKPSPSPEVFTAAWKEGDTSRSIYIFGQLGGADKIIPLAQSGAVKWWPLYHGRAFFGDLDGLRKIHKAMSAASSAEKPDPTTALKWIAEPYTLGGDTKNTITPDVIRQLLDWKADPNIDGAKWLEKSLRTLEAEHIRPLIDHGAAPAVVFRVMDDLLKNKNFAQAGKIQEALSKGTLYLKVDEHTLMESKYVPGAEGGAFLKSVFNFRSRRVNEIYEQSNGERRTAMTSVGFDEYDPAAIGFAEEQLRKLGGKPPEWTGKPRIPTLGGQAR